MARRRLQLLPPTPPLLPLLIDFFDLFSITPSAGGYKKSVIILFYWLYARARVGGFIWRT